MEYIYKVQPNGCRICPYNRSHVIASVRFVYHLMKCAKSSGKSFEICPYNAQHHVVEPYVLEDHIHTCESRSHAETERAAMANGEAMTIQWREEQRQQELRVIEARAREQGARGQFAENLPDWFDEEFANSANAAEDVCVAAEQGMDRDAGRLNDEAEDQDEEVDVPRVQPAYAVEAQRRLREECIEEYERVEQLRYQRMGLGRGASSRHLPLGRAQTLKTDYCLPKNPRLRTVPHQYMLHSRRTVTYNTSNNLPDASSAEYNESKPSTAAAAAAAAPAPARPQELDESNSEDSYHSTSDCQDANVKKSEIQVEPVVSERNNIRVDEDLSVLEKLFYSLSLSNLPNVTEVFRSLVTTAKMETVPPKHE